MPDISDCLGIDSSSVERRFDQLLRRLRRPFLQVPEDVAEFLKQILAFQYRLTGRRQFAVR